VRSDLVIGQINILLVLMIVTDLTVGVSWRGSRLPEGVLVGLAAAIKLTPLVFIPYLVVSRQWRAARNATLTFVAVTGAMLAVTPHASWLYFSREALDVKRIGQSEVLGNQTLHAAVVRAHFSLSASVLNLIAVAVLCAGIALAAVAYNRASRLLATLVCAGTGLMLSPISWMHHYVWIVPALIWVFLGVDRPAQRAWWTAVVALPFFLLPRQSPRGMGVLWYLRDNAYVVSTLVSIGFVGLMLWSRRQAFAADHAPESEPDPIDNSIEAASDKVAATRTSDRPMIRGLLWSSSTDTGDRVARHFGSSGTPRKTTLGVGGRPPVGP
jgi:alpha-1,2-mannosyltransferase